MSDQLATRVRSAAAAGWWTILIAAIWLTLGWLSTLCMLRNKPDWVLWAWGGKEFLTWDKVHSITLTFMAVWEVILFALVLATIWLSLWARKLKRAA